MGMYDNILSEIPLPDGFTGELRSRDFDCFMTTVLIRADGRLMVEEKGFERVPLSERPFPDDPNPFKRLTGGLRTIHKGWKDLDYHGDFRVYGYESSPVGKGHAPHQYVARFTHGTLKYIKNEDEMAGRSTSI